MRFECITTGSKGNCYILTNKENQSLVLDLGVAPRFFNFLLPNNVDGILISHNHNDHNKKIKDELMSDIMIQKGYEVITPNDIETEQLFRLGDFEIVAYNNTHNIKCYSYLIRADGDIYLFTTDSSTIPLIEDVMIDYFIVECNFDLASLNKRVAEVKEAVDQREFVHLKNVYENHCSLEYNISYFENLGYRPQAILSIHKSNSGLLDIEKAHNELSKFTDKHFIVENGMRLKI